MITGFGGGVGGSGGFRIGFLCVTLAALELESCSIDQAGHELGDLPAS